MQRDLSGLTFEPTPGDVLSETFGDEAVVVQLRTGVYYAFDAPTTALWSVVQRERSLDRVAGIVAQTTGRDRTAVAEEVAGFAAYLAGEQLGRFDRPLPPSDPVWPGVSRFTDMADLLVMDPIHDIDLDGDGWPAVRPEQRIAH